MVGEFLFLVGECQVSGLPGTFVYVPRNTVHAAKVIGTEPGKVLAAYIPGTWSDPSRSSPSCAPSREKTRVGARAEAGPWLR